MDKKTLYLVRHAKSSWESDELSDHERPLNKRGLHDAPMMGKRLVSESVLPELIICSSANRAETTAQLIAKEIGYKEGDIKIVADLYCASVEGLTEIIHQLDPDQNRIMVIGHNPGMTQLVNWLCDAGIFNIPTCGIATLQQNGSSWNNFTKGSAKLLHYDYPKKGKG